MQPLKEKYSKKILDSMGTYGPMGTGFLNKQCYITIFNTISAKSEICNLSDHKDQNDNKIIN